jgi:hypothetical protein
MSKSLLVLDPSASNSATTTAKLCSFLEIVPQLAVGLRKMNREDLPWRWSAMRPETPCGLHALGGRSEGTSWKLLQKASLCCPSQSH